MEPQEQININQPVETNIFKEQSVQGHLARKIVSLIVLLALVGLLVWVALYNKKPGIENPEAMTTAEKLQLLSDLRASSDESSLSTSASSVEKAKVINALGESSSKSSVSNDEKLKILEALHN